MSRYYTEPQRDAAMALATWADLRMLDPHSRHAAVADQQRAMGGVPVTGLVDDATRARMDAINADRPELPVVEPSRPRGPMDYIGPLVATGALASAAWMLWWTTHAERVVPRPRGLA